ncbi:type II secretion system protein GspL [Neptunicella sp. SCSIO 80796]|uniref:type II secretion system protein GspL n=1 Tax=Neptunicella plasticusilytica TaxID=3117012 RepID=UPI003A4E343C
MSEQLVVRLGSTPQDSLYWMVWSDSEQEIIASGELPNADALGTLGDRAGNRPITILVPTSDLLLKWVTLPGRPNRKVLSAIPYMLEDELNTDVDSQFFAIGPKNAEQQAIAVVSHDKMLEWQSVAESAGLQCNKMIPDVLALPANENVWSLINLGDNLLIRQDQWQGMQGEAEWLMMAVEHAAKQQTTPLVIHCLSDIPPVKLANVEFVEQHTDMPLQVLAQGALECKFNLLQGDYKVRQQGSSEWKKWRAAAILAGVALLTTLIDKGLEANHLRQQQQEIQAQIEAQYQRAFPNGGRYRDIKTKITDLMKELQQGGGGVSLLAMLSQLSEAFDSSQIQPQTMKFSQDRSELRLQAVAKDFNALEKFKTAAESAGFEVQQGAINNNGDQVISTLTLRS